MIEEKAIVVAIENEYALVQTQRRSACQSCSVKQGCGTSVLSKVVGKKVSQIRIDNTLNVNIGDEVLLGIEDNALVQGSLLMYALPLVFLLFFAVVGEFIANSYGLHSETTSIVFGLVGFIVAIFVTRIFVSKSVLRTKIQPRMLRIINHATSDGETILAP